MGTPDFAVPSLTALNREGCRIALVVTQPDRPKGRGRKRIPPPVKTAAEAFGCEVIQPESIRTDWVSECVERVEPDLFVVVAFGQVLPKYLLSIPSKGAINLHASVLPKYRGPAPIQRAILNMEKETGVTTMLLDEGLDTGDILLTQTIDIKPEDTGGTLHDRLADIGAELLIRTLRGLEKNELAPIPQDHSKATYAPLLKKSDGKIEWMLPAERIEAFVRGMNPWPGAFTFLQDKRLKLFKAGVVKTESHKPPGTVIRGFPDELRIATGEGLLSILELQGESGKRLSIKEFLRGCEIPVGSVFR